MLEIIQKLIEMLNAAQFSQILEHATLAAYGMGLVTGAVDVKLTRELFPDIDAIAAIGIRTHALSEKAMAQAKGDLAFNANKLYQEMDAAVKAGMSEREALGQIETRVRTLFENSYQNWEIERLVRDQVLVATKEGRRDAWQEGGAKYRQWKAHFDNKTAADSKRMNGQIAKIDEPYVDPKTGDKYMIPHIRPNDRCIFGYQTPVFTSKGLKPIAEIEIGELVLTHTGQFKKVIDTFSNPRYDDIYKIHFEWVSDDNMPNWTESLSITAEHPLLTTEGFKEAQDLEEGESVVLLADECHGCGNLMPFGRKYCSRGCVSRAVATEQWKNPEHRTNMSEKAKVHWNKWNKENPELRKESAKNSHKVLAEKAKIGQHPLQLAKDKNWVYRDKRETIEIRKKISVATSKQNLTDPNRRAYLRSDENLNHLWSKRGMNSGTMIERIMESELQHRQIEFEKQHQVDRFFLDFAVVDKQIAIECDGWYWHQNKEADAKRDYILEDNGWTVLHFTDKQIKSDVYACVDEIERILANHNGEYRFIECIISKIERIAHKKSIMTYNLEVEDDHSFIAKGIVTHNCYETALFELPEYTTKDGLKYAR